MTSVANVVPERKRATWLLAIGVLVAVSFLVLYLMGLANAKTFALAFAAAMVLELARGTGRGSGPLTAGQAVAALAAIAACATLSVLAIVWAGQPATTSVPASYILGFVSGSFATDGAMRHRRGI